MLSTIKINQKLQKTCQKLHFAQKMKNSWYYSDVNRGHHPNKKQGGQNNGNNRSNSNRSNSSSNRSGNHLWLIDNRKNRGGQKNGNNHRNSNRSNSICSSSSNHFLIRAYENKRDKRMVVAIITTAIVATALVTAVAFICSPVYNLKLRRK